MRETNERGNRGENLSLFLTLSKKKKNRKKKRKKNLLEKSQVGDIKKESERRKDNIRIRKHFVYTFFLHFCLQRKKGKKKRKNIILIIKASKC